MRNPPIDDALESALVDLWVRVSNAGGAVGFLPPTSAADVAPVARAELDSVRAGRDDLVVALADDVPLAFGFLATSATPATRHVGEVRRLQRDPEARGRGLGAQVLAALERAGWDRGLELLTLTVRGGTGHDRFYRAHGWSLDAVVPGRLRGADGGARDVLHLSKRRDGASSGGLAGAPSASARLAVRRLDPELPLPAYAHPGDAGLDLHAAEDVVLAPGTRAVVPTGVAIAVPDGHVGLVHPRSGLAARHGLTLVNAPGTIDAGYRGEVKGVLANLDADAPVTIARGDRVAQLVVQPVTRAQVVEVDELPAHGAPDGGGGAPERGAPERGAQGFGSTGR